MLGGPLKSSGYKVFNTEPITSMDISTKEPSFIAVAGRKGESLSINNAYVLVYHFKFVSYMCITEFEDSPQSSDFFIQNQPN